MNTGAGIWFPRRRNASAVLGILIALVAANLAHAQTATPDDTARFLAGLQPSHSSPLAQKAADASWQIHARIMNTAWAEADHRIFSRMRVWAAANLPRPRPAMFYMFGGPDFVHTEALFPHAVTYVLSGLEPVGSVPDATTLRSEQMAGAMEGMRNALGNFLQYGYFITSEMGKQLRAGVFDGTLPVLYVFLARSGKTVRSVVLLRLNRNGTITALKPGTAKGANGVRIVFSGRDGQPRRLYYFRTDLSNAGVAKSGFLKFCARLGAGDALVKSASYLMHTGGFSKVREFLLAHSSTIMQDDSGIPLKYFEPAKWSLKPYGQYVPPIEVFKAHYQEDMARLFARARAVNFGIGYHWHPSRTNILVAERLSRR